MDPHVGDLVEPSPPAARLIACREASRPPTEAKARSNPSSLGLELDPVFQIVEGVERQVA